MARLARSTIRPLALPVIAELTGHKPANNYDVKPSQPRTSLLKTAYDVAGTVCTVLIINFTSTPFILLHLSDGIEAWCRLRWYGVWTIFGAMAFFYGGGTAWLKGLQAKRVQANATAISTSGPGTPDVPPTVPPLDSIFRDAEKKFS